MNGEIFNLETIKKAKQLSECIRLMNNKNISYLDLAKRIEEKSKNLQKPVGINYHQEASKR